LANYFAGFDAGMLRGGGEQSELEISYGPHKIHIQLSLGETPSHK